MFQLTSNEKEVYDVGKDSGIGISHFARVVSAIFGDQI